MGALDGIRVIDLTMWFQGPVAGQLLADFGAEVIHVERPQGGDLGRGVRSIKAVPVGDWNQYFLVINRNKKSLALDLNQPSGTEALYRLAERSDVFLTNLTPENIEKWELTYEHLREVNPRLVYAVASGFGHAARSTRPSFDLTVQALTGIMSRLGEPGQPPIYLGMGSGDAMGGLMTALGIVMALYAREETGRGQLVDASLYGAQLFLGAPAFQSYLATGDELFAQQRSRRDAPNPLWNVYPAQDRWLFLCLENTDVSWGKLAGSLGETGLADDARFASAEKRRDNGPDLVDALDGILCRQTAGEWLKRWQRLGITAAPVNNLAALVEDEQAWANRYLVKTHCEEVDREVVVRGLPIGLSATPGEVRSLGPELGQHTEEILVDTLGYDWEKVVALKEEGAIL